MSTSDNFERNINNAIRLQFSVDDLWDKYKKEYYKTEIIKCKYLSKDFLDHLSKDLYFALEINSYNKKKHTDYNFATYLLMFDFTPWMWALGRNVEHKYIDFKAGNEYEFEFTFPINDNQPSFEDYKQKFFNKNNDIEITNNETNNNVSDNALTVEQFLNNVKKAKEIEKQKNMSKRRSIGKQIEKYDLYGNLLETYENRTECIIKNNLTKSGLSQHLNGKRKSLNGYIYKEI